MASAVSPVDGESNDDSSPGGIDQVAVMEHDDLVDLTGTICVVDIRDNDYARETNGVSPIPNFPDGMTVVRMPYQTICGHVEYCRRTRCFQKEMRPPPSISPWVNKGLHMTVYSDIRQQALDVARVLVLSHVPHVSILDPQQGTEGFEGTISKVG